MIPAISGAIGPLGPNEWGVGSVGSIGSTPGAIQDPNAIAGTSGHNSFSGTLTNAINSLEQTQVQGTSAAQGLATGQLSDPTQAITAVENASLAMDLASQIRTKLVDATQNIFQTQV
ncbi:MAG: flagellar hook-basal body complex protein FliE [Solirubrobacteraceae bacterium]